MNSAFNTSLKKHLWRLEPVHITKYNTKIIYVPFPIATVIVTLVKHN